MADLSQIKINDTTYNIKDATARESITSEATTRANADTNLSNQITALQAAVGAPLVAATVAGMTDTTKVYVYTGSESGYTNGNWYYYDGTAWVSGGTYNSVAIGDGTITAEKLGSDVLALINASGGLTADIKQALLDCFEHVAWIDANGQTYYDALETALYPPANLLSITCVYTQSGTVYDTDSLDDLKTDLVVTANYDDNTTETVTTYTLSGTLTEGTSTITVTYGSKTTTFNVTVSHKVANYLTNDEAEAVFSGYYLNVNKTYSFYQLVSSSNQTAWVVQIPSAGTYRLSCYCTGQYTNPGMASTNMGTIAGNANTDILSISETNMDDATTERTTNTTLQYPTAVSARTDEAITEGTYAGTYRKYIDITYGSGGYIAISGNVSQGTWVLEGV